MRLRSVKQKFAAVFAFVFLFTSVPALSVPVSAEAPSASSLCKNTGARHETCTALSDQALAYYTGNNTYDKLILLDGTKTTDSTVAIGSDLFNRLKSMMQPANTISYKSLTDYYEKTDTTAGFNHAVLFYSDAESDGSSYNREHVWPKSHGNFVESGAGSDLHHLRPANQTINSTRGNYTMGNVKSKLSNYSTKGYGNKTVLWYSSSYSANGCDGLVEVADDIKGDVARIYLYVYVTYGSSTSNKNLFTTCSSYGSSSNDGKKVIESLATLLEWNAIDPVDEWEMQRNDLAEQVQGNRNVFIDYPELAWYLFGVEDELPEMETPSGNAMGDRYTVTASSSNTAWGTVSVSGNAITASPKGGYFVSGYEVISGTADVTRNGNSFRVVPSSDCSIRILFSPMTLVTVTYMANGGEYDHEQAYAGETISLPQAAELTVPDGWTFAGWVDSEVARTDEKPAVIHESEYTITKDTVLYALFSQMEAGTGTGKWTKLTSMDDFAAGTEIVFASNAYNAIAGGLMNGKVLQKVDATFSTDADKTYLEELPDGAMVFTVGGSASGWTFTSEAGQLYANAVKELNFSENGTGTWTVSVSNGTSTVTCTDTTKESLEYNASSPRFTTYSASSNQKKIQIYFLDGSGGTPYYATSTCSGSGTEHQHEFSAEWSYDGNEHWHACTGDGCTEKADAAEHKLVDGVCSVCGYQAPAATTVAGDSDGDGDVTDWDAVLLTRYLAGWDVTVDIEALDIDGDHEITDWDSVLFDRYLAGWNVTVLIGQ